MAEGTHGRTVRAESHWPKATFVLIVEPDESWRLLSERPEMGSAGENDSGSRARHVAFISIRLTPATTTQAFVMVRGYAAESYELRVTRVAP